VPAFDIMALEKFVTAGAAETASQQLSGAVIVQ
jgi:hypothetical protein